MQEDISELYQMCQYYCILKLLKGVKLNKNQNGSKVAQWFKCALESWD